MKTITVYAPVAYPRDLLERVDVEDLKPGDKIAVKQDNDNLHLLTVYDVSELGTIRVEENPSVWDDGLTVHQSIRVDVVKWRIKALDDGAPTQSPSITLGE